MKNGALGLLAAVLLGAALAIGCIAPMDSLLPSDKESIPDGMGAVQLVFNQENDERVIIPGTPVFTSYNVIISDAKGIATDITESLSSNAKTYMLNEGDYTIEVEAFTSSGLAAVGEKAFHITAGQSTAAGVQLQTINFADATRQGTFSYDIAFTASSYTTATMTITARGSYGRNPGTSKAGNNIYNFLGSDNPIGSTPLDVGYYSVVFELKNGGNTTFYREVLHIYQNLTSRFEYRFTPPDTPVPDGDLVPQRHLNYTENPIDIPNPERGYYKPRSENVIVPVSGTGSGSSSLSNIESDFRSLGYSGPDQSASGSNPLISCRIVHIEFNLGNFSSNAYTARNANSRGTTQPLSAAALAYIRSVLGYVRNGEAVADVRFKYDEDGWSRSSVGLSGSGYIDAEPTGSPHSFNSPAAWDPNVPQSVTQWVQYHIYQIKPILQEYEDVIMAVGGFFGPWGEMHSTSMANAMSNHVWLFNTLMDVVPASRQILTGNVGGFLTWYNARYSATYNFINNHANNIINLKTSENASRPEAKRIGYINDSYSCGQDGNSDQGSLSEGISRFSVAGVAGSNRFVRNEIITWIRNQNNFYGGETNTPHDTNYSRFPFVAWEGPLARTSHLNIEHYAGVLNTWRNFNYNESAVTIVLNNSHPAGGDRAIYDPVYAGKNGLEFVRDRLGYRLVLRDAQVSDPVARGGTLVFKGKIQNVGWGNVINKKDVRVILKPKSGSAVYTPVLTSLDPRDWQTAANNDGRASNTAAYRDLNFSVNMSAFGNVPAGDYNIYLKIQDPRETSAARRCIRFANNAPNGVAVWDSALGANLIGSVTVTNQ